MLIGLIIINSIVVLILIRWFLIIIKHHDKVHQDRYILLFLFIGAILPIINMLNYYKLIFI